MTPNLSEWQWQKEGSHSHLCSLSRNNEAQGAEIISPKGHIALVTRKELCRHVLYYWGKESGWEEGRGTDTVSFYVTQVHWETHISSQWSWSLVWFLIIVKKRGERSYNIFIRFMHSNYTYLHSEVFQYVHATHSDRNWGNGTSKASNMPFLPWEYPNSTQMVEIIH